MIELGYLCNEAEPRSDKLCKPAMLQHNRFEGE
jgi:hypothetical protein